ncbi:hypothetical protein [Micromonospora sp. NPDC004704]
MQQSHVTHSKALRNFGLTVGITLIVCLLGALCQCGGEPVAEAPPGEKSRLFAALPSATGPGFGYTITNWERTFVGEVGPSAGAFQQRTSHRNQELGATVEVTYLCSRNQIWAKVEFTDAKDPRKLPTFPDEWMLLNYSRMHVDTPMPPRYTEPDVGGVWGLLSHATSVNESEPGIFTGRVDLAGGAAEKYLSEEAVQKLGDTGVWLPFRATLDQQGRLATMAVSVPKVGDTAAYEHTITYRNYGTTPTISLPDPTTPLHPPLTLYNLLAP